MGLGMACAVLHIGAHPDDEDIGMKILDCWHTHSASLGLGGSIGQLLEVRGARTE
jgi:hypothetical protein